MLGSKESYPTLRELDVDHFAQPLTLGASASKEVCEAEKRYGSLEIRVCVACDDPAVLTWLDPHRHWSGLESIAMVLAGLRDGETVSYETRLYLNSLSGDVTRVVKAICSHRSIEDDFIGFWISSSGKLRVMPGPGMRWRASRGCGTSTIFSAVGKRPRLGQSHAADILQGLSHLVKVLTP